MKEDETPSGLTDREVIAAMIFDIAKESFAFDTEDRNEFEELELIDDVGCDTLDVVEFIMTLEHEFDIRLSVEEAESIMTFGNAIDIIWDKLTSDEEEEESESIDSEAE